MIEFSTLLLVSMLFGGMLLYSFGFAPIVFSTLPAENAGRVIRAAFPWYYLFIISVAGLGGALLLVSNIWSGALALAISAAAVYARQVLMPQINDARDAQLQGSAAAKQRFGRLHGISVAINFLQLIAAGCVIYRLL